MAEYKGIKAILTKFYKEIKLSAGNGIQISDENVVAISDALSTIISELQSTVSSHTSNISSLGTDISSIKSVNTTQSNLISSLNSRPYITASNFAETGYVKWSNGLLIQWGKSSASNNTSEYYQANVTMQLAYKSASSYQVVLNGIPAGSVPGFVCALDNTGANGTTWTAQRFGMQLMYCSNPRWIAIGKA